MDQIFIDQEILSNVWRFTSSRRYFTVLVRNCLDANIDKERRNLHRVLSESTSGELEGRMLQSCWSSTKYFLLLQDKWKVISVNLQKLPMTYRDVGITCFFNFSMYSFFVPLLSEIPGSATICWCGYLFALCPLNGYNWLGNSSYRGYS